MATAEMPPVNLKPIAGGANSDVRGQFARFDFSVPSPASSVSSVDTDTTAADSDSADDASSVATDASYAFPPSPPVQASPLAVPAASAPDYFSHGQTFLHRVFPRSKVLARAAAIEPTSAAWQLALFDEGAAGSRTLYARGADFDSITSREHLVALMDRADEELDCDQLVVVLDKHDKNLAAILHSLLYVGGVIIKSTADSVHKKASSSVVLVGIEL